MKNKIKIALFVLLIISIIGISFIYKEKDNKPKRKKHESIAIMIKEDEKGEYIKSNSKDIPKGNYILNYEKSYCKNNGKIGNYDSTLGKVSFSFIGSDSCFLYFDLDSGPKGYETILLNNSNGAKTVKDAKKFISDKGTPDFSKIADTNEGMYAAEDDLGTSYYFRGAVDNNWVKIGKDSTGKDIYWRIIRINGDGSIRIIYSGTTSPSESTKVVMTGKDTVVGESKFNDKYTNAVYVGYMYTLNEQHGIETSSPIKIAIDNWYKETTLETEEKTKKIVSDQIFCNDRSITDGSWPPPGAENLYYAAYTRLMQNNNPSLLCSTESDKFTISNSNGNGALTYPVGLITADEVVMAGGVKNQKNKLYYLYSDQRNWAGTPYSFSNNGIDKYAYVYILDDDSGKSISGTGVHITNRYFRPVISLSSSVKLTGDGTWNNPYVLEKENPIISDLKINGNIVTATFTDNKFLSGYAISTSNTVAPTNWKKIGGKAYHFNETINLQGSFYLWVKDNDGNKTVSSEIDLLKTGRNFILANNKINATTPDFSKIADTNEGIFTAEDDLGTSYYFRGAVDNNWVKFGKDSTGTDMYWRIMRINGDGSIRMIYTGTTAPTEKTKVVMTGEGTQIGNYRLTDSIVGLPGTTIMGYMYTNKEQHGNSTSSNIKTKIEDWYAETTLKDNPLVSQNQIFCNDRSASSTQTEAWTPTGEFYYGAYGRLEKNKTPILTCPTESDKFTSKNSTIGNKALTYPVGLLTADEASMAGGLYVLTKPENTNFYLYTNQTYWLGSPEHQSSKNYNFIVRSTGIIYHETETFSSSGVRPVISLSPSVKLSGNGTWNNVYEVVN